MINCNIDLLGHSFDTLKKNAIVVVFEKKIIHTLFGTNNWQIVIDDDCIKIINIKNEVLEIKSETLKAVEIGIVRKFLGASIGIFLRTSIVSRIEFKHENPKDDFVILCEDYQIIKKMLKWAKDNKLELIDYFNLKKYAEEDRLSYINLEPNFTSDTYNDIPDKYKVIYSNAASI